jgi:hypothetical protein
MRQWTLVPDFQSDLQGLPQIPLERLSHRLRGRVVKDQNVALGVEIEGTEIEVRGTDDRTQSSTTTVFA